MNNIEVDLSIAYCPTIKISAPRPYHMYSYIGHYNIFILKKKSITLIQLGTVSNNAEIEMFRKL